MGEAREFGRYFEEFEIGDVYKHWPGKTITEYDDHLFCAITWNHHPLHTNEHYAETQTHFKQNVIVGNLVYSLALGLSGYHRGVVMQVFSWGGFILGIIAGALLGPPIVHAISPNSANARRIAVLASFLGIAFIVEALIAFAGSRISRKITHAKLKRADQIAGAVVASVLALLAAWMLSLPAKAVTSLAPSIKKSAILPGQYAVLSRPPAFLAAILSLLNHTGFPQVFAELNPSLAPGVQASPASLANNMAILTAAQLTFKVEEDGCQGRVDGSGF